MPWQHIRIARFGGPEVLELAEEQTVPAPGPGEVRIKVLAAGTGFTDTFIRRGRYPDFGPAAVHARLRPRGYRRADRPRCNRTTQGSAGRRSLRRRRLRSICDPPCAFPRSCPRWC